MSAHWKVDRYYQLTVIKTRLETTMQSMVFIKRVVSGQYLIQCLVVVPVVVIGPWLVSAHWKVDRYVILAGVETKLKTNMMSMKYSKIVTITVDTTS